MIVKIKLGDLTARQMKAICIGYNHCPYCPLRSEDDYTCYFNNDTIPTDYDLDKEIEVSTDFLHSSEYERFEKRIEDIEKELLSQKHRIAVEESTSRYFAGVLGCRFTEINPRSCRWRVVKRDGDPLPTDEGEVVCPSCKRYAECEQLHLPTNALDGECVAFERKEKDDD